jgi:hypothetical protein
MIHILRQCRIWTQKQNAHTKIHIFISHFDFFLKQINERKLRRDAARLAAASSWLLGSNMQAPLVASSNELGRVPVSVDFLGLLVSRAFGGLSLLEECACFFSLFFLCFFD